MNLDVVNTLLVEQPVALWLAAGAVAAIVVALLAHMAPAKTTILVDTPTSTVRADQHLLWGFGPHVIKRALPRAELGQPIALLNDVVRVGNAFLTPGIADVVMAAVQRLMELKPRTAHVSVAVNTGDYAKDLVVQTAVQAALTMLPAATRERVEVGKCAAPGAEITTKFELYASPMQLGSIWNRLRRSKPAREFIRRLTRKPKPVKKPVREVRAS